VVAQFVDAWNARMNLTGHHGPEAVMTGLIVDAIALEREVSALADFSSVADLGSGAGFPGIPFAILDPSRTVRLVDSRERRHHFQRAVRRRIEASNLIPVRGRLEVLEAVESDLAICQALAQPSRAVELALPWTRPGGLIVIPGAEHPPEPGPHPEIHTQGTATYSVPGGPRRTLWWGRRRSAFA
jgi:16S rRNA (guanine527-N7)-methyltransferase